MNTLNELLIHNTQNTLTDYIGSFIVAIILLVLFIGFKKFALKWLSSRAAKTENKFDDSLVQVLQHFWSGFYYYTAIYIGAKQLSLGNIFEQILDSSFIIMLVVQALLTSKPLIEYGIRKMLDLYDGGGVHEQTTYHAIRMIVNIVLWISSLLLVISNLGFNVTSLIASLGVWGIAIAFALQNILSDIFASFSIFFDKPFQVNDFIAVWDQYGTVQKIGLRSTRLKTLRGEELIIPNQDITSVRVQNFAGMQERRIVFSFCITYETPNEQLKKIPHLVEEIIDNHKDIVRFDRCHFSAFGDYSLCYEVVYYVNNPDYQTYMDINQAIHLEIKEQLEWENIRFAYPTQKQFHVDIQKSSE